MFKKAAFFALLSVAGLSFAAPAEPLDRQPSLTLWGQYVRVLVPDSLGPLQGGGGRLQMDWQLAEGWAVGLDFGQVALSGGSQFGSLGLLGRYTAPTWNGLNPYVQLGLGYGILRESFKSPVGGGFHGQLLVGDVYVLNKSWAVDGGVGLNVLDGPPSPVTAVEARLGLNYRFGRQRYANLNPAPEQPVKLGAQPDRVALAKPLDELLGLRMIIQVKPGDSLWRLARRENVLGTGWLWPLLYKTNREQIRDPGHIVPGMKLKVRSNYSKRETDLALKGASDQRQLPLLLEDKP